MPALISSSSGGNIRACTAICYDAIHSKCECCCGGMNHGVGFETALKNTLEWVTRITEEDDLDLLNQIDGIQS